MFALVLATSDLRRYIVITLNDSERSMTMTTRKTKTQAHNDFDYRNLYDLAIKLNIVSAITFVEYGRQGLSPEAILDDLCVCAFNSRHDAKGSDVHAQFVSACDAFHAERRAA